MVRIRMKSFGRRHRPFYRICAMDSRTGRDGRAIEELGHYDPMVRNLEARTVLNVSRIRYWLSVGAQPSEKVQALLNRAGVKKPAPGEPWQVPDAPAAPVATAPAAPAPRPAPSARTEDTSGTGPATTPSEPKTAPSDNEIAAGAPDAS